MLRCENLLTRRRMVRGNGDTTSAVYVSRRSRHWLIAGTHIGAETCCVRTGCTLSYTNSTTGTGFE